MRIRSIIFFFLFILNPFKASGGFKVAAKILPTVSYAGFAIPRQEIKAIFKEDLNYFVQANDVCHQLKNSATNRPNPITKGFFNNYTAAANSIAERDPEKTNTAALIYGIFSVFFAIIFIVTNLLSFYGLWFITFWAAPFCVVGAIITGIIAMSKKKGHFKKAKIGFFAGLLGAGLYALGFNFLK